MRVSVFTGRSPDLSALVIGFCELDRSLDYVLHHHTPRFIPGFRGAAGGKDGDAKSQRNGAADIQAATRICRLTILWKMLKRLKQATLQSLKTSGISAAVHNSRWRRQRLLILAYHGISLTDEHLWSGSQFMPADVFRNRLTQLKRSNCAVLPLGEAIARLYANDLPDRAVVLTFDDGTSDFLGKAFPLLREFDFPATLYLT